MRAHLCGLLVLVASLDPGSSAAQQPDNTAAAQSRSSGAAGSDSPEGKSVELFNGRDLAGWTPLNVPKETFFVRDGMIVTSGKPTGLMRTERMYENFIIEFDWRHMESGGNSGLFIWADGFPAKDTVFPRGIEVQILDPGYNQPGKNEWFTTHGDIFPVNGAELTRAGRISPNGQRSFPSEDRTKPSPQWNHYRVVATDGDISLAVNGKEVTIAKGAEPRKGFLMLESEGAETHFKNFRFTELPSTDPAPEEVAKQQESQR